jgi:hypothetical protein
MHVIDAAAVKAFIVIPVATVTAVMESLVTNVAPMEKPSVKAN